MAWRRRHLVDVPGNAAEPAQDPGQRHGRGDQRVGRDRDRQARQAEPERAQHEHPPDAETGREPGGCQRAHEEADRPDREREPDGLRGQVPLLGQVQDEDRAGHVAEEVGRAGRRGDRAQPAMVEDVAEADGDVLADGLLRPVDRLVVLLHRRLRAPDPEHEHRRHEVADRVDHHRERRLQHPDQEARDARAQDLGRGLGDLELGVALDELVALHDRRQVALPRDVEEHREAAVGEADDVQLPDGQGVEVERDRDGRDRDRPAEVADDQDRPPAQPVDPDPRRQAEQDERQELDRRQEAELERRDVEDRRRDQRQGELRDRRAEDRDGLCRPELQEVGVAKEAAARATHGRRVYGVSDPQCEPARCRGCPAV